MTLTPPAARVEILRDTYYGVTVEDPYRWMEDWKGEELQAWLKAQAAYTKVKDGVKYPAVLLATGLNDPRVVAWQATKRAARLQAATTASKPILLRVELPD